MLVNAPRLAALALLLVLSGCSSSTHDAVDAGVDAARDAAGEATADTTITPDAPRPDIFVPFSLELTVNDIPASMNGSQSFTNASGQAEPFRLALPPSGFTVDVRFAGSEARPQTLRLSADVAIGGVPAGSDLSARFTVDGGHARWQVAAADALPLGPVTFTARLEQGTTPHSASLAVDIAARTAQVDPFALEDTWLLLFSLDHYTIDTEVDAQGNWRVITTKSSNGVPDFVEDLRIAGFGTPSMLPSAAAAENYGVKGTNEILRVWIERLVVEGTRRAYLLEADGSQNAESPRLRIVAEGDPGAPKATEWKLQKLQGGETAREFSMISIGGGDPTRKLLGLSQTVDPRNRRNEANVGPTYGVFPTTALATAAALMAQDPAVKQLLGFLLGEFVPELGLGGRRVGEDPVDGQILAAGFDPDKATAAARSRYKKLVFLAELLGRLLGALTAHEMGHALGLVAAGPPPYGLFGGEKNASFTDPNRTTLGHIDTPGFNIMEAGPGSAPGATIDLSQYLGMPSFNALNRAYLQGRLLLQEQPLP
jgi:hypothetical protein